MDNFKKRKSKKNKKNRKLLRHQKETHMLTTPRISSEFIEITSKDEIEEIETKQSMCIIS